MAASGIRNWGYDVYRRFNNLNMHDVINARGHVVVWNVKQHINVYLSEENCYYQYRRYSNQITNLQTV